jgi:ABC-type phosphate transport system substrate-binding protein
MNVLIIRLLKNRISRVSGGFLLLIAVVFTLQISCLSSAVPAAEVVLVANQNIPVNHLTGNEVKNIFLTKIKNIHGVRVKPVMLPKNELTAQFLKQNVGKTFSQFSSYYKKMIFTGRGRPPRQTGSEQEMLAYVSKTGGAIGYVSREAVTRRVKIIQVTE